MFLFECVEFVLHQKNHEDTRVVQILPLSATVSTICLYSGNYIYMYINKKKQIFSVDCLLADVSIRYFSHSFALRMRLLVETFSMSV